MQIIDFPHTARQRRGKGPRTKKQMLRIRRSKPRVTPIKHTPEWKRPGRD